MGEKGRESQPTLDLQLGESQLAALFASISAGFALVDGELRLLRKSPVLAALETSLPLAEVAAPLARGVLELGEPMLEQRLDPGTPVSVDLLPVKEHGVTRAVALVAVDKTGALQAERQLDAQVRLAELVSTLSTKFVDLPPDEVDREIVEAVGTIIEALGIDRSVVMTPAPEGDGMVVAHAYTVPGKRHLPLPPRLLFADYPWMAERGMAGHTITIADTAGFGEAPVDRATLASRGIVSGAVVPLKAGDRILGFITFVSLEKPRDWPPETIDGLRLVGEIIANALDRKRHDQERGERLRFEQLLSRLSATFVRTPPEDVDVEIEAALGAVCVSLGFDRAVVIQTDGERLKLTHEWKGQGVPSFEAGLSALPISEVGWPISLLQQRKALVIHRDSLPPDAHEARRAFELTEVQTSAAIPLSVAGHGFGMLSFHATHAPRLVPDDFLQRLRLVGEIIASTLTRQRQAQSLRESEARFVQLLASALDGVAVVDQSGVVLEWSAQCERMFGSSKAEVLGKSLASILFADAAEKKLELQRWLGESSRAGLGERIEIATSRSDGASLALELTLSELSRSDANWYACFLRDITDRKRVEAERRKAFEEISRLKGNLERERDYLREEVRIERQRHEIVGQSTALNLALEVADAVAGTNVTVLVRGESGVGKELFAHAIHSRSSRSSGPLVKVNCASIPKNLFESEFFGHVRGSFTGAHRDRVGRFELADRGTLFLDEVGEIPGPEQAKLLRVLQEGEFERVGDDRTRKVDVRVIAATNRDLEREISDGRFRRDLYYRLCAFPVVVPPLRERREDIVAIASHFLGMHARAAGRPPFELTARDIELLEAYDWPGNIRELEHVIERAVILSKRPPLRLDLALPGALRCSAVVSSTSSDTPLKTEAELREFERQNLIMALARTGWRISGAGGAAELLGIRPSTLRDRMRAFGIVREE